MPRPIALLAALALTTSAPAAHAQDKKIVGLLDVRAEGVDQVVRERFAEAVEEGLAGSVDYTPASRKRMLEMLAPTGWSPACLIGPCLAEVRAQTGAEYVVTAGVSGSGQSYRLTISLIDTEHGILVSQVTETCPACTVEDVASSAMLSTIELINGVSSVAVPPGRTSGPPEPRGRDHARAARRTGVLLLGTALLAAGAGAYFLQKDRDDVSYPLLGAAAGLAVSGTVTLGLSLRF